MPLSILFLFLFLFLSFLFLTFPGNAFPPNKTTKHSPHPQQSTVNSSRFLTSCLPRYIQLVSLMLIGCFRQTPSENFPNWFSLEKENYVWPVAYASPLTRICPRKSQISETRIHVSIWAQLVSRLDSMNSINKQAWARAH